MNEIGELYKKLAKEVNDFNNEFYKEYLGRFNIDVTLSHEPYGDCWSLLEDEMDILGCDSIRETASCLLLYILHERSKLRRISENIEMREAVYRIFELIEPIIKSAIAQAIQEHLEQ